jgi:hypothetical protein
LRHETQQKKNLSGFSQGFTLNQATVLPWTALITTPISSPKMAPDNAAAETASGENDNKNANPPNKIEHITILIK